MRKTICILIVIITILSCLGISSFALKFTDVSDGSWMENAVYYCYNNGIIGKTGSTTFSPNSNMKRGDCLHGVLKALNISVTNYSIPNAFFEDVPASHTYANKTSRFYTIVKLKEHLDTDYLSPFKTVSPHQYTNTISYLNACRNYGYRYSDESTREFHQGLDFIHNDLYTDIYSVSSGKVLKSTYDSQLGKYVQVYDNSKGIYITYQHLSSRLVSYNDNVTKNTKIGVEGNTGHSGGPHLHLSFSKDSKTTLDSRKYLDPVGMLKYIHNGSEIQCMPYNGN